jgi:hypothetical protein
MLLLVFRVKKRSKFLPDLQWRDDSKALGSAALHPTYIAVGADRGIVGAQHSVGRL